MFRVLEVDAAGAVEVVEGEERAGPPPEGRMRWIDLVEQTDADLQRLATRFGFHPLAIEDCAHFDQRPKLERYGDHLFLVTHGFALDAADELQSLELHTFLGENYLVTVHAEPIAPLEAVWNRVGKDGAAFRHGTDFVCYLIADAIVDTYFPLVDHVAEEVEDLEEVLLERASHEGVLANILRLKRLLVTFRKVLAPQRDVLSALAKPEKGRSERTTLYFRDVHDHVLRIAESVEATRDLLNSVLDAYLWTASQRTNEIVKRLTVLSAIFMPLTFITGFFGQNFEGLPFGSNLLMATMLVACVALPAAMLYFFVQRRWF